MSSIENRISFILKNKDRAEQALRLRLMRVVRAETLRRLLPKKAYAKWEKAYAEWEKAYAKREKTYAEREKAYAEWEKSYAEWEKSDAEWKKSDAEIFPLIHAQLCPPGCPWNGRTIL